MDTENWKLLRCIYDYDGRGPIEGEYCGLPDRFEEALAKSRGDVGWIIGKPIKHDGGITVKVILEGDKETLEYVLGMVKGDRVMIGNILYEAIEKEAKAIEKEEDEAPCITVSFGPGVKAGVQALLRAVKRILVTENDSTNERRNEND